MKNIITGKGPMLYKKLIKWTPERMIFIGFLIFILFGALLLTLPISSSSGNITNFTDALFTATSSVCVTGLVVVDTNTYWSGFGKIVILTLIQIGALGIMSLVTLVSVITGRSLGLSQRIAIKESISNYSLENIVTVFRRIMKMTFMIEGIGALLISVVLIPAYGPLQGIGKSIFHAVSAFCNAGFDVFGTDANQFASLTAYNSNYYMLLTTAILIILGGLGFIVWDDVLEFKRFSRFQLHTKIVICMTIALIALGTVLILIFESHDTLSEASFPVKLLNAFFHSVSTRTAGFNTISLDEMDPTSSLITIMLMFIGAAPGSTGGGIKVTTMFIILTAVVTYLKGHKNIHAFKRKITAEIINKAFIIFILSLLLILITTIVLLINKDGSFLQALFEAVSAFATVGLSTGITPGLEVISKYQLIITMFLGRIGIITAFTVLTSRQGKENVSYRYPEGKITV